MTVLMGCEHGVVPTQSSPLPTLQPPPRRAADLTTVNGDEFYADEQRLELVPTSSFQARIDNESSTAGMNCSNGNCNASFSAAHKGMWHWSTQTLNWHIEDPESNQELAGSAVPKSGGNSCESWATLGPNLRLFCTNKAQNNSHTATVSTALCQVRARLTTDHAAGYGLLGSLQVGAWTVNIISFGEK